MPDQALLDLARDVDDRCRLHGKFLLRSGTVASEYFDKYLFEGDPELLRRVVDWMVPLVPSGTEVLAGLELGGVPLATLLSSVTRIPTVFVRKQAKEYGTRRLVEGGDVEGRSVLLVEDVITTGGAVVEAAGAVRGLGATTAVVLCAIDRSEPGGNRLPAHGVEVRSVLTRALLDSVTGTGSGA